MAADRDAGVVPEQWLTVLEAVARACAAQRTTSASTRRISLQIKRGHGCNARTVLRVLHRRGYVYTTGHSVDGAPLNWGLTEAGQAVRKGRPVSLHGARRTAPGPRATRAAGRAR